MSRTSATGARHERAPLRRATPLRPGPAPARHTPLTCATHLRPRPWRKPASNERPGADRAASEGAAGEDARRRCVGEQTKGITPAHLARSLGGCDDPACVVPMCWLHHRAYDTGRLELLPHLEPRWRAEVAHAVLHPWLIGTHRRLGRRRDSS